MKLMTEFWDWVDTRAVVRRVMTLGTFALTVWTIWWATEFAEASPRPGSDIAMIIGAVMVPINWLMGHLFTWYSKARGGNA